MSLLQDPVKALDQIEWYLDNTDLEKFPGAFHKAAGNLSRQVLEQILFILAFYSRMPQKKYMKQDFKLLTADKILRALNDTNPVSRRKYLEEARRYSPRIRKFARYPRSLNKWRRDFNEPSHFRNPATRIRTDKEHIQDFLHRMRLVFDSNDVHLITAAVNELLSKGRIKAAIGNDPQNTPGIEFNAIVTPEDIEFINGKFRMRTEQYKMQVVPADQEISLLKWRKRIIFVQHSHGISIRTQFVTQNGEPIDLTSLNTALCSLGRTADARRRIKKRLKKFGIQVEWNLQGKVKVN